MTERIKAIVQALLVTFIWATSWVLIKFGLEDVPALLFAGLRYGIGAICLIVILTFSPQRKLIRHMEGHVWIKVIMIGLFYYAAMQGAQFLGLRDLPATSVNLIMGLSTIIIALLGTLFLKELLSWLQWMGVLLTPVGAYLYFFPVSFSGEQTTSIIIVAIGTFLGAIGSLIARDINRSAYIPPLTLTTISLTIGSLLMFVGGLLTEGFPPISLTSWGFILWMAVINTAFAFTLWNKTMQVLRATENAAIANTLMVQVPLLAYLFLGERITPRQIMGLGLVVVGVVMVQVFRRRSQPVMDIVPDS